MKSYVCFVNDTWTSPDLYKPSSSGQCVRLALNAHVLYIPCFIKDGFSTYGNFEGYISVISNRLFTNKNV